MVAHQQPTASIDTPPWASSQEWTLTSGIGLSPLPRPYSGTGPSSYVSSMAHSDRTIAEFKPRHRHIAIVTDAWDPMMNGVVTRTKELARRIEEKGVQVSLLTPQDFPTIGTDVLYPGLKLSIPRGVNRRLDELNPDGLLVMTEYSLGWAARNYAKERKIPFASAFTTNFCDMSVNYKWLITPKPATDWVVNRYLQRFHRRSNRILVNSESSRQELIAEGYPAEKLTVLGGAVDLEQFHPSFANPHQFESHPKPWFVYVGRVSKEKALDEFLDLDLPGTKIVVGDGPALDEWKQAYPNAVFLGRLSGPALSQVYASADVFVFPSEFETLGRVVLEAMASGVPVAAKPVRGPIDVIHNDTAFGRVGFLDNNLNEAILNAWAAVDPHRQAEGAIQNFKQTIRQYCETYFRWEAYAPRVLNAIPVIQANSNNIS